MCEIWPENERALALFLACRTQWRAGPMGGVLGLDYPGVLAVMRIRREPRREQLFADLQVMETAAIDVLNRKE